MIPTTVAFGRLPYDPAAHLARPPVPYRCMVAGSMAEAFLREDWEPCRGHNLVWGTCSTTGLANAARAVEIANGADIDLSDDLIAETFAKWTGTDYTDAAMRATKGARLADILDRQTAEGFNAGTPTPLVGLTGRVGTGRVAMARAIRTFKHAYIGVTLRERDMEQKAVWDVQDGRDDGAVVGGHCIVPYDFTGIRDDDTTRVATWGFLMPATWPWIEARTEEAHVLAWRQLALPGVDFDALEEALAT